MGFVGGAVNEETIALLPNPLRLDSESTNVISERGILMDCLQKLHQLLYLLFQLLMIYTWSSLKQ